MRFFCAVHQHLGLVVALRRYPELRGEPVIVGGAPQLRLPVVAASATAISTGVRPGMPLRQAQQLCPQAAFVPLDVEAAASLRAQVEAAVHPLSPVVEVGDAELLCDLSGSHAQHPTEAAWAAAVARALQAALGAEPPAAGVAGSRFTARMAARSSGQSRIRRVPPGEEAAFLAPLPLGVLPVSEAVTGRLAALGLECLGAVAAISPADLQRQFGPEGLRLSWLVRGDDGESLHPGTAGPVLEERLVLDGAVGDLEALAAAAAQCARELGRQLVETALAATRVGVTFEVEELDPVGAAAELQVPVDGPGAAWTAVLSLLSELHPGGPVTAVRVELSALVAAGGRQADLWRAGDSARDAVLGAAGRLRARFGETAVRRPRLATDPGDLPERRFIWDAPLAVARS